MRPTFASVTNIVIEAAQGAVGAIVVDTAMGQLVTRGIIPATMLTPMMYPVIKGGVAIGVGLVANMLPLPAFLKRIANEGVKGSLVVTLTEQLRTFVPATLPLAGRRLGYAVPGRVMVPRSATMGEYLQGNGNYVPMSTRERQSYYPSYGVGEYLR